MSRFVVAMCKYNILNNTNVGATRLKPQINYMDNNITPNKIKCHIDFPSVIFCKYSVISKCFQNQARSQDFCVGGRFRPKVGPFFPRLLRQPPVGFKI